MATNIITYPILFQMLLAVVLLFFWNKSTTQRWISVIGSVAGIVLSIFLFSYVWNNGIQTIQMGGWKAPFGISLVADTLAVTLVLITHIIALAVSIFSNTAIVSSRVKFGYYPILHLMIMGLSGAFMTGDIFNLYVWFEVIIISSFVLLTIGGKKVQIEGAVKYFTLNMLASIVFLTAIALLYGTTGTLNMAELAVLVPTIEDKGLIEIIGLTFFVAFGVKAGVFPLYVWLPASYHTPPSAVSALFGGLLTKLGVYAMIRVFTLIFPPDEFSHTIIQVMALLTIFGGAVGAYIQRDIVKVFSYLIICHIGFMIAGLSLNSEIAIIGAVFYMIHDMIVKANLFLVSGISQRIAGSSKLESMGGVLNSYPKLAILFAIPLFSLVGIPPLSGFWPKISLFQASLSAEDYWTLGLLIFGSFMTLVVVAKVWNQAIAKKIPNPKKLKNFVYFSDFSRKEKITLITPIVLLSIVSLYIGFSAETIQVLVERIATELNDHQGYFDAVFTNKTN